MDVPRHLLAIDAGTTGGRVSLFTAGGELRIQVRWLLECVQSPEAAPWGRAFDPDAVWRSLADAVRKALASTAVSPRTILAVAVTSQRQGIALLDDSDRTLYVGPNVDLRGIFQGAHLQSEHSELIYAITGHLPPYLFAPARLLWFQDHQPERYARISTLLMLDGWLAWLLSGTRVAEVASAAESGLFDVTTRTWSTEMIDSLGLPVDICPTLLPAGTVSGHVSEQAAAMTGLEASTPVVIAGPDTQCGLLGMGVTTPGQRGIVAGWSAPTQQVVATPTFDPQRRLWMTCHLLPETWVVEANAGLAGQAQVWLRDLLVPGQSFDELDHLAAMASLEQEEFQDLPVLAFLGPRLADYGDPRLLWGGLVFPLVGGLDGLGQVKRTHVARAGLENIAFALRANLGRAGALAKPSGDAVRLGGGLARSQVFVQILANVLGTPVWVSDQPDVTSLGACLCAAVGIGFYPDLLEASVLVRSWGQVVEPQRIPQAHYLDAYERWRVAYDQLEQLGERIDR